MAWTIEDRFPDWGETGEFPTDGFFYDGGDQVNEKHLDALWNGVKMFEDEVRSALSDIDSDGDGVVDDSDQYDGTAPSDGDDEQFLQTDGTTTSWVSIPPNEWVGDGTLLSPDGPEIGIDVDRVETNSITESVEESTADSGYLSLLLDESNWFETSVTSDLGQWNEVSESPLSEAGDNIQTVAFGDGYVAYGTWEGDNGNVYVHNTSDWSLEATLTEASSITSTVAFGDGYIAYGGNNNLVFVHNTSDWSLEETLTPGEPIESISFGGGYIAYGIRTGDVLVRNTSDWSLETTLTEAGDSIEDVAFGDGYIIYGSSDNDAYVHNTSNWFPEATLSVAQFNINSVGIGDEYVAYGDIGGSVYIHNISDWSPETTLDESTSNIRSIVFSDEYIIYGVRDSNVYIHNLSDWSLETTLTEAGDDIEGVGLGDGYVAYGGNDNNTYVHQVYGVNPIPVGEEGNSCTLYMEDDDGNGPYTINWPANILWPGGNATTTVPQNSNVEVELRSPDGGETWRAEERNADWQ